MNSERTGFKDPSQDISNSNQDTIDALIQKEQTADKKLSLVTNENDKMNDSHPVNASYESDEQIQEQHEVAKISKEDIFNTQQI